MHLKMGKLVTFVYFITIKKLGKQNKKLRLLSLNMGSFPHSTQRPLARVFELQSLQNSPPSKPLLLLDGFFSLAYASNVSLSREQGILGKRARRVSWKSPL